METTEELSTVEACRRAAGWAAMLDHARKNSEEWVHLIRNKKEKPAYSRLGSEPRKRECVDPAYRYRKEPPKEYVFPDGGRIF